MNITGCTVVLVFLCCVPIVCCADGMFGSFLNKWMKNPLTWFTNSRSNSYTGSTSGYNPDTDLTTAEIASRHGYAAESHIVRTEDGYLLTMHRIPCGRNSCEQPGGRGRGQPILLQHGLLASSADWVLSGPEKALAFILADLGYDVWLGNARGNTYSRKHVNISNEHSDFWNFSWHEMAMLDLPAEIDYVYSVKSQEQMIETPENNLLYIGHSMGTTMMFAMLSHFPEYNDRIRAAFALAPVAYMSNVKSPIRMLAPFSKDIQVPLPILSSFRAPQSIDALASKLFYSMPLWLLMIIKFFGNNQFLPQNKIIKWLSEYGCELTEAERFICENTVFVLCGFDKAQYNATLMPVIFGHTPAGTSTKTVVHYAQEIHERGNFQYYDYGTHENLKRYGKETPPSYAIQNITTPIALFYATNDWLAGPQDVKLLFDELHRSSIGMFQVPFESFNHVDFLWGVDAPTLLYKPLIELMQRYK